MLYPNIPALTMTFFQKALNACSFFFENTIYLSCTNVLNSWLFTEGCKLSMFVVLLCYSQVYMYYSRFTHAQNMLTKFV